MNTTKANWSFRKVVVLIVAAIALSATLCAKNGRSFYISRGKIVYVKNECECGKYKRDHQGRCTRCGYYYEAKEVQFS